MPHSLHHFFPAENDAEDRKNVAYGMILPKENQYRAENKFKRSNFLTSLKFLKKMLAVILSGGNKETVRNPIYGSSLARPAEKTYNGKLLILSGIY